MPEIGFRVKITGIREKILGSDFHKKDIGSEGVVVEWMDIEGFEVWIPKIILYDVAGTICYGSKVWWTRIS